MLWAWNVNHERFKCNDLFSVSLFTVVAFTRRIHFIVLPQLRMTMFLRSASRRGKSLSSRSGSSRGGFQPVGTYNRGLKLGSCGWTANNVWRRTLRQKSLICKSNSAAVGDLSEGLNLSPNTQNPGLPLSKFDVRKVMDFRVLRKPVVQG